MSEHVQAWQCIGCGRIEAPQTCIGVCRDVRIELVDAAEHDATLAQLKRLRREADALRGLVRRLAWTQPRAGAWERSYRALQDQARRILAADADATAGPGRPAEM